MKMVTLIFSKNRAMQLQATLESYCELRHEPGPIVVLYKATLTSDNYRHNNQYEELKTRFPDVMFYSETNFAKDVRDIITTAKHVLFVVDDCVFFDRFSLENITDIIDRKPALLGFSLRLGKNTRYSYTRKKEHGVPKLTVWDGCSGSVGIKNNRAYFSQYTCEYNWTTAPGSFDYPLELSSSVYRTEDILPFLLDQRITGPNKFEAVMSSSRNKFASSKPCLACYEKSVAFCNPVNRVQEVFPHMEAGTKHPYSIEGLADRFDNGEKIDISAFHGFVPNATHVERGLSFVAYSKTSG